MSEDKIDAVAVYTVVFFQASKTKIISNTLTKLYKKWVKGRFFISVFVVQQMTSKIWLFIENLLILSMIFI